VFPAVAFGSVRIGVEYMRGFCGKVMHDAGSCMPDASCAWGSGPLAGLDTACRRHGGWGLGASPKPDSELGGLVLPRCYSRRRLYTDFVSSPRNARPGQCTEATMREAMCAVAAGKQRRRRETT
jgi:hypothetical protein